MLAALHTHPQPPDRAPLARMTHALIVLPSADAIPIDCPERPLLLATLTRRRLAAGDLGIKVFFLSCVLIVGLYGAASASRKILFVQALPAALGLAGRSWPWAGTVGLSGAGTPQTTRPGSNKYYTLLIFKPVPDSC